MDHEWHAIVNPAAGGGRTRKLWPGIAERIQQRGVLLHQHETSASGDATDIARAVVEDGVKDIVVVGGDGTLNEVVNGILGQETVSSDDVVLSLVPCGTGRDFSRTLGIRDPDHAVDVITSGCVTSVDVGVMHYQRSGETAQRFFVNVADVGLGAETAAWMNQSSKRLGGFLGYLVAATRTILVYDGRPARVMIDGALVHDGPVGMIVLANGRYFAGGMFIAPEASIKDGKFDIFVLDDVPKHTLLMSLLPKVYRGKHVGQPGVHHYTGKTAEILSPDRMPVEVDGEQPGTSDITATVRQGALKIRTPRQAT